MAKAAAKPDPLPDVPPPQAWACVGCRWGRRVVDLVEIGDDPTEGDEWKPKRKEPQESYICRAPEMTGGASVEVVGRLWCGFREEPHR